MVQKTAIIIGAGPGGLTAAHELLTRANIRPIVFELTDMVGGLSRTVNYKGNRIDIGGHRFFSKSDRVMKWWLNMLPLQSSGSAAPVLTYQNSHHPVPVCETAAPESGSDCVMLLRPRKSRIYYLRHLFSYPISLSRDTLGKLGLHRTFRIGVSYIRRSLLPLRPERTLEEFLTNRFGDELYRTFFKSYTEKVWGVPCDRISAEWGAQRIKGLSIRAVFSHGLKKAFGKRKQGLAQKNTQTSLIEQFLYPKFGPGQMWEEAARRIREAGGEIHTGCRAGRVITDGWAVKAVEATDASGAARTFAGDYFFSTAPVQELMRAFDPA